LGEAHERIKKEVIMFKRLIPLFLAALLVCGGAVWAQDKYPERAVEAIIPYAPGSALDLGGRVMLDIMQKILGQPFVPINKPGAGGYLGGMQLVKSKPDGYTIGIFANTQAIPEVLAKIRPASYSSKDLQPVANFSGWRVILAVNSDSPFKTLNDLVDYGKKNVGQLRFGHVGVGNSYWQVGVALAKEMGFQIKEMPYNGEGESLAALLGNHIDYAIMTYSGSTRENIRAKKLRVLCTFERNRMEEQPDVLTNKELGLTYDFGDFIIGTFLPKGTPKAIVAKLSEATKTVTESAEFKQRMGNLNMPIWFLDTADFEKLLVKNIVVRTDFLKAKGLL
jgi:tripartite-type tricarboxylate transporter receptor subunit TctC